jgi:hypothetical protein
MLQVKTIDDSGALAAHQGKGKTPGAHVLIGVWAPGGPFHPMRLRNNKGATWNYDLVVPFDVQLNLTVSSAAFDLTDEKGAKVTNAGGASVPIQIATGTTPAPVVFHVTQLKNRGGR